MHKKWIKPKNNLAIEIQNLNKTYKSSSKNIKALSNVNLNSLLERHFQTKAQVTMTIVNPSSRLSLIHI